ncbi:MAG: peptidylprolyl isomerase [Mariprofundus sp.]|nr:peptidylprolyl isomerase [Mariprofundus sp.]
MKRFFILFALTTGLLLSSLQQASAGPIQVTMTTSMGVIKLELDRSKAPISVANFLKYAKKGSYNGTIFHRVIPNFMIQGGGFNKEMQKQTSLAPITNEADNGLPNTTGSIAMARTSDPHSASNQFFINTNDNAFLNHSSKTSRGWGYAVFGRVISGMDVVRKIETVATGSRHGMQNVPENPVIIESVKAIEWADAN